MLLVLLRGIGGGAADKEQDLINTSVTNQQKSTKIIPPVSLSSLDTALVFQGMGFNSPGTVEGKASMHFFPNRTMI